MELQTVVVLFVIAMAFGSAAVWVVRKPRAFSIKKECGSDCGCGKMDNG